MTLDASSPVSERALLADYARQRSPQVLERLVRQFQPLARSLASRYKGGHEPLEDLVQVANLGLVKAIQGFDPGRGPGFTSYAVPTILGELRRHFRDRVWNLRLPRGLQESVMALDRARTKLTEELGREPSVREIADRMGVDLDEVLETLQARDARNTSSADQPVRTEDEAGITPLDLTGVEDPAYDRVEANVACSTVELEERESDALELVFARGMTQAEAGRELGCSQMQVSRLSRRALEKLLVAVQGDEEGAALAA